MVVRRFPALKKKQLSSEDWGFGAFSSRMCFCHFLFEFCFRSTSVTCTQISHKFGRFLIDADFRGSIPSVTVFEHGEGGFPCIRIPAITRCGSSGTLHAFAECRMRTGDGCVPTKSEAAEETKEAGLSMKPLRHKCCCIYE